MPITGYLLLHPLEVEAGNYADSKELVQKGVKHVVVLGASVVTGDASPADRWQGGLFRVMEGIRLWKAVPSAMLVLSGGSYPGGQSSAEAMAVLPEQCGVPRKSLMLETRAKDTAEEARLFTEIVGNKPFALVTSAVHMPRSLALFRSLGADPIACPCDFQAKRLPAWYTWFLPYAEGLQRSHAALHEYYGKLWLVIRKTVISFM